MKRGIDYRSIFSNWRCVWGIVNYEPSRRVVVVVVVVVLASGEGVNCSGIIAGNVVSCRVLLEHVCSSGSKREALVLHRGSGGSGGSAENCSFIASYRRIRLSQYW